MTVCIPGTDPEKNHCRFGLIYNHLIPHPGLGFPLLVDFFPSHLALYCKYTQYSEIYTASINTAMRPVTVLSRLGLCVTVHGKGQYYNNISATQW